MAYWLVKTEPSEYQYADLERAGHDVWDGVTNPTALKHLRAMQPGDQAFVYHTGNERAIVGICEVVGAPRPDPAAGDPRIVVVDVRPVVRLPRPVPLAEIKARPECQDWELVRIARLSVMPVPPAIWRAVLALAGSA